MGSRRIVLFGWASKVQVHLTRWARGLSERGYEVKVIALGGDPIEGLQTCNLPRRSKFSYITQARAAVRQTRDFKPDLVHAHYATGYGFWANMAGVEPTVISVYGSDLIEFPTSFVRRRLLRWIINTATHITSTSQFLKDIAIEIAPRTKDRISVIPFGVDLPGLVNPEPATPPIKVCFIKNHNHRYGPDVLLEAMVRVRQTNPRIKLSVAGTGELNEFLKEMSSRLGLNDTVAFVGFVPHSQMPLFIEQHHIMVMPSRNEAFGVAVLETSACSRPVIASDVGGVSEVLVDGETGILVPKEDVDRLAEAIIRLAEDAALRNRMGASGRVFVQQNYTWEKSLDLMTDLYERLIHEKGKVK
ncbi:MAG: glycosyltransferase [Candidatus Zixiibacteriota bacterium]